MNDQDKQIIDDAAKLLKSSSVDPDFEDSKAIFEKMTEVGDKSLEAMMFIHGYLAGARGVKIENN